MIWPASIAQVQEHIQISGRGVTCQIHGVLNNDENLTFLKSELGKILQEKYIKKLQVGYNKNVTKT